MKMQPGDRVCCLYGTLTGRRGTVRRLCDLDFSVWVQLDQPITEADGVERHLLDLEWPEPMVRLWPMDVARINDYPKGTP